MMKSGFQVATVALLVSVGLSTAGYIVPIGKLLSCYILFMLKRFQLYRCLTTFQSRWLWWENPKVLGKQRLAWWPQTISCANNGYWTWVTLVRGRGVTPPPPPEPAWRFRNTRSHLFLHPSQNTRPGYVCKMSPGWRKMQSDHNVKCYVCSMVIPVCALPAVLQMCNQLS